jgi:peptidoglycan-associated lipoprotein
MANFGLSLRNYLHPKAAFNKRKSKMHLKILSLFAAVLLVTACQTSDMSEGEATSTGSYTEDFSADPATEFSTLPDSSVGDRVYFATDKYNIDQDSITRLEKQAVWINDHPDMSITIEGNCDESGTREYNLGLGERRANAVKNYLAALGVDASRIDTVSFGKEKPIALGSDAESWTQNRNAQTVVY